MAVRPIHDRGITGSGVTVAAIDSGLDVRLCQFSDPSREIPFDRDDPQHRKVVRYDAFADRLDSGHGHGTHVCEILAGKVQCHNCTAALYDGHAPDAKIYFVDCGNKQTPRSLIPEMRLPEVFQSAERLGCSVMSNSWGCPSHLGGAVYRVLFDETAYRLRGMLMVFGAGNSRKRGDGYAPASSKNVIGVGGTTNLDVVNALDEKSDLTNWCVVSGMQRIPLRPYHWSTAMGVLLDREPHPNLRNREIANEFMVIGNSCSALHQLNRKIMAAFARLNRSWQCQRPPFPVFAVDRLQITKLKLGMIVSLDLNFTPSNSWSIPKFTSAGPSDLGLVKPDVVAPGQYIVSTRPSWQNTSQCSANSFFTRSGSSFAVPAVSGADALIVQYLRGGWFPKSFTPSGMLLKALLVNGASPRRGPSSLISGFGIIQLDNISCLL
jgi:subtilisin family serine protease